MVSFAVITVFCILVVGGECLSAAEKEILSEAHKECAPTSGVTDAMINDAKKGILSEDMQFKEHALCILKKLTIMTDDGKFDMDVIKELVKTHITDEATATQIIEKCAAKKATPQESAFEMFKCVSAIHPLF